MTLLFMDGFDVEDTAIKWQYSTGFTDVPRFSATTPFGIGRSLRGNAQSITYRKPITPSAEPVLGVNFMLAGWDGAGGATKISIFQLRADSGTVIHLTLAIQDDGTLRLYRGDNGGTLLALGPPSQILLDVWYFIEIKATIDDSTGSVTVKVDGADAITFVGDTRNGGSSTDIDVVGMSIVFQETEDCFFDDFYVANTAGSVNNDFLGMGRVQTLLPDGAGTDTDLAPTGSPDNYENVNDVPWSSADYNSSDIPGDRDTYTLDNLASSTASVAGIQTVLIAHSDDATAQVKAALRSGGTVYYDADVPLNGAPSDVSVAVRETDPATSAAWTVSGVNALEAGMEIVS